LAREDFLSSRVSCQPADFFWFASDQPWTSWKRTARPVVGLAKYFSGVVALADVETWNLELERRARIEKVPPINRRCACLRPSKARSLHCEGPAGCRLLADSSPIFCILLDPRILRGGAAEESARRISGAQSGRQRPRQEVARYGSDESLRRRRGVVENRHVGHGCRGCRGRGCGLCDDGCRRRNVVTSLHYSHLTCPPPRRRSTQCFHMIHRTV